MAVCGHYVCDHEYDGRVYSGEYYTSRTRCNRREECSNGDVDEKYCIEKEVFGCSRNTSYISISKVCNKRCDCYYCDDEWRCGGYNYHYWYTCSNGVEIIPSYYICDNHNDCYLGGDDESNCANVTTCVIEGFTPTYLSYRCIPWICCANKLDHTNCTDTTLAPLQCPVSGYTSTVSRYIICKSTVYGI